MSIMQALKDLVGYTGSDLDQLFVILSTFIVIWFLFSLFNILTSLLRRGRY